MEDPRPFFKNMLKSTFKTKVSNTDELTSPVVSAIKENTEAVKDKDVAKQMSKPIVSALVDVMDKLDEKKEFDETNIDRLFSHVQKMKVNALLDKIEAVKGDPGEKPTKEELEDIIKPLIPEPIKGDKGDDYVLTEKDKKDIAKTIKVPVVEKVIEHTVETVVEKQPIVTNEIKEVAVADKAEVIKTKLESLEGDDRLDAKAIKNLPKSVYGGGGGIKRIDAANDTRILNPSNGQALVWNSTRQVWENGTVSGDADVVHDTGDETIAGVKTFSSDPIIPDEAYGAGWNGSLEPATKNAIYDKIETLGGGGTVDTANSPNANEFARFTDADTIEGRTASEVKADLDLEIGTDIQAYDAELSAIAGLTSAADKGIQFTGSGTAATYDLTTAGKALLDDADASAQRTTLGLGTMATETATNYVAKSLFDAHTILQATSDNTPAALTVSEQTVVGRATGGNITALAIDSDLSSVSANDDTIPSAKATKSMGDLKLAIANNLSDLNNAGTARTNLGLGTAATKATDLSDLNEATIEAAIDTLANLTSIQGRTVTLADAGANAIFGWDDTAGAYENLTAAEALAATGVTASAAEVNILDGATLSTTELNHVDGVTSAIQTQLDARLPLAGGTMTGNITLGENTSIALDPAGSADGKYSGITVTGTAGYTQAFGDLVYLDPTDSRWEAADANSASGADGDARGMLGMVVSAGTDGNACTILLNGIIRADANFPTFTVNNPIYVSETAGDVTQTQPTTTDAVIRIVGAALTGDEMYFNPDWTYTTHV